jgi:hypothetical protein
MTGLDPTEDEGDDQVEIGRVRESGVGQRPEEVEDRFGSEPTDRFEPSVPVAVDIDDGVDTGLGHRLPVHRRSGLPQRARKDLPYILRAGFP